MSRMNRNMDYRKRERGDKDSRIIEIKVPSTPNMTGEIRNYKDSNELRFLCITNTIDKIKNFIQKRLTDMEDTYEIRIGVKMIEDNSTRSLTVKVFGIKDNSNKIGDMSNGSFNRISFIKDVKLSDDEEIELKSVIFIGVEEFISLFKDGLAKMGQDVNLATINERNIRLSRNAVIKHLESLITIYALLMKRTCLSEVFEILLNGSYTYQSISYSLANVNEKASIQEKLSSYVLRATEINLRSQDKDSVMKREVISIEKISNKVKSHELNKELKIKIFKPYSNQKGKLELRQLPVSKILAFTGAESVMDVRGATLPIKNSNNSNSADNNNGAIKKAVSNDIRSSMVNQEQKIKLPLTSPSTKLVLRQSRRAGSHDLKNHVNKSEIQNRIIEVSKMNEDHDLSRTMNNIIENVSLDDLIGLLKQDNTYLKMINVKKYLVSVYELFENPRVLETLADYILQDEFMSMRKLFYVNENEDNIPISYGAMIFELIVFNAGFNGFTQLINGETTWADIYLELSKLG